MTAIIDYSELLAELARGDNHPNDLDKITKSGTHILGLINQILDLFKVETGKA